MKNLRIIDADAIADSLSYTSLVASLEQAFMQTYELPDRLHFTIGERWGIDARLLIMVAWGGEQYLGIKLVTLHSDNPGRGLPALSGMYCLFNGKTGEPLALLDGAELTAYRTAAASMLAARYLANQSAETVLIIGAGKLSSYFIHAYTEIIGPKQILLWNRDVSKAEAVVDSLNLSGTTLAVAKDLESAVRQANIISTLTSSRSPVFPGSWCQPGCHIDLVGGYRPDMREVDDELMKRARIYVDTYQGALQEAGDIIDPLNRGVISKKDIRAELAELVTDKYHDRKNGKDVTLFKSVGSAIEDITAAVLVYEKNKTA